MLILFSRRLRSRHNRVSCHGKVRIVKLSGDASRVTIREYQDIKVSTLKRLAGCAQP